jgi:hypothetical protein
MKMKISAQEKNRGLNLFSSRMNFFLKTQKK